MNTRQGLHVVDTTRKFPRSLREAFPHDHRETAIETAPSFINKLQLWLEVFNKYRGFHGKRYAARIAFQIAFRAYGFDRVAAQEMAAIHVRPQP